MERSEGKVENSVHLIADKGCVKEGNPCSSPRFLLAARLSNPLIQYASLFSSTMTSWVFTSLGLRSVEEGEKEVSPGFKNLGIYARTIEYDWGRPTKAPNKFSLQRLKHYFDKLGHLAAKYNKPLLTEHAVAFLYPLYPAYALKEIERIPEED